MININQLGAIFSHAGDRIFTFFGPLNDACDEFNIDTPQRIAPFLAQIAHESCELKYLEEIASGEAYEGRADLGNAEPGDGVRFKGRGLLQITGRFNYQACGAALGLDLIANPELLITPANAARSAGWFWRDFKKLNALADAGDFREITKRINGGFTGYADRLAYLEIAKEQFA